MKKQLLAALFALSSFAATAKDYGVLGKTYPIKEQDLIEAMKQRMAEKVASGEIQRRMKEARGKGEGYVKRPAGSYLPRAAAYSAVKIDVRYTLQQDIKDANNNVLFKKGTTINPLEIYPLQKGFCFINGDDEKQVKFARNKCHPNNKIVLINGDYEAISQKLKIHIYFDQHGNLIKRFNITAVPTVIRQSGNYLVKEVFPVENEK